jgi:hypothetical protein
MTVFYSYYCRFNSIETRNKLCEELDKNVSLEEKRKDFTDYVKNTVDLEMQKI